MANKTNKTNSYEDELAKFVAETENEVNENAAASALGGNVVINPPLSGDDDIPENVPGSLRGNLMNDAVNRMQALDNETVQESHNRAENDIREDLASKGMGWLNINLETLPTKGMFYPEGTKIQIRAAAGGEIRHWSTMSDDDFNELDDAMNYVVERCVSMSIPGKAKSSFKDLIEVDRFYLIIAIRDFTFIDGHNELKITVDEKTEVTVHKENIEFLKFDDTLMKYYDKERCCFTFDVKTRAIANRKLHIYLPTVGVDNWFKEYVRRKSNRQEGFDKQFIKIAPLLIRDYRGLNEATYNKLIGDTDSWGAYEWSLISEIVKLLGKASGNPVMKYMSEDGAEMTTPLNFRGGFKSLFTINLEGIL